MALWSKKPAAPPATPEPPPAAMTAAPVHEPAPMSAAAPVPPPVEHAAVAAAPAPLADTGGTEAAELSPEELNRRRLLSKHISATFGEIVSMLMRQAGSKHQTLGDLEWMVLPPLMANQFAVAEAQSKAQGFTSPVAVVLWARVSAEVDQRLASTLDRPIRLAPAEWTSGDIVWLIEASGEPRALQALLQRQAKGKWQGRSVKFRSRDKDGRTVVSTLPVVPAQPAA